MNSTANSRFGLHELAAISAGFPVRGAIDDLPEGDIILLQMRDIDSERGIVWSTAARFDAAGKRQPNFLELGDVLFTSRGTRNVAVAITDLPQPAVCAANIFIIRLRDQKTCTSKYLAWFMNQFPAQAYFQREATGTNIQNIRREVVENLIIPVPSLCRQMAIVEFAECANAERSTLRALIKNREQQLEALALCVAENEEF